MAKDTNAMIARALLSEIESGKNLAELTSSLAAYLIEERRLGDLNAIVRDIEKQLLERKGILYVHATVARELGADQLAEITEVFKQHSIVKQVIIEQTINPDVIGGVRCQTADEQLDLTVRRQLQSLTRAKTSRSA